MRSNSLLVAVKLFRRNMHLRDNSLKRTIPHKHVELLETSFLLQHPPYLCLDEVFLLAVAGNRGG